MTFVATKCDDIARSELIANLGLDGDTEFVSIKDQILKVGNDCEIMERERANLARHIGPCSCLRHLEGIRHAHNFHSVSPDQFSRGNPEVEDRQPQRGSKRSPSDLNLSSSPSKRSRHDKGKESRYAPSGSDPAQLQTIQTRFGLL